MEHPGYLVYEAGDLGEQFSKLKDLDNFSLIPLFDRGIEYLLKDLNENPVKYDISDIGFSASPSWVSHQYKFIVEGKLVEMTFQEEDIDAEDEDEMWWMKSGIWYEKDRNEETARRLMDKFKEFVGSQNLDDLMREARQELKEGKTYHLTKEMQRFYLEK